VRRNTKARPLVIFQSGAQHVNKNDRARQAQPVPASKTSEELLTYLSHFRPASSCGKPVICAINGYALGSGLELAMSCDIRLASSNARFGAPEIKLGWIGGGRMSYLLARSIGPSNAALMLMTGDPIDAARALAL
jgi:enoyl-CoA hydratase/carnithine racemase